MLLALKYEQEEVALPQVSTAGSVVHLTFNPHYRGMQDSVFGRGEDMGKSQSDIHRRETQKTSLSCDSDASSHM